MNKPLVIVACFTLALVLGFVLVWPKYQNLQALRLNIKNKEAELQSKKDYFSQVNETSQQLAQYKESLAKVLSALPKDPSLPSLFNFFQKNIPETGLILEEINLGGIIVPQQETDDFKEIQLGFQLSGSYQSFKYFLSVIEHSSRLFEVQSLTLDSPKADEKNPSYSLNIKTHSY